MRMFPQKYYTRAFALALVLCLVLLLFSPLYSARVIKSPSSWQKNSNKPCAEHSWDEFSKIRTTWVDFWGGNRHEGDSNVAVDHQNKWIYITVNSMSYNDFMQPFLLKYNFRGRLLWSTGITDQHGKVMDSCTIDGFVYVTGLVYQSEENIDVFVAKYNANAEKVWFKTWDGSSGDIGFSIVCDNANVYVGGRTIGKKSSNDVLLLHYTDDGNSCGLVEYKTWGGAKDDLVVDMVMSNGVLYLCGTTMGAPAGDSHDAVLLTCDTSDSHSEIEVFNIWGKNDYDQFEGLIVRNDYLVAVGWSRSFDHHYDIVLLRYGLADKELVWERVWGEKDYNIADALAHGDQHFYLTGEMRESDGVSEERATLVMKFDSSGEIQWSKIWGKSYFAKGEDICFYDGNLYVVGCGSPLGRSYLDAYLFTCDKEGKKALVNPVFTSRFQNLQWLLHRLFRLTK